MRRRAGLLVELLPLVETAPEVVVEDTSSRDERRRNAGIRLNGSAFRYCAAFTSFQISLYLARRGTFCQKYSRFW